MIELVRAKPELYDLTHKLYSDNVHKKVLEEIGTTLKNLVTFNNHFISIKQIQLEINLFKSYCVAKGQNLVLN